jgi:hypothetical protein
VYSVEGVEGFGRGRRKLSVLRPLAGGEQELDMSGYGKLNIILLTELM